MTKEKENMNNTFIRFLINKQSITYLAKFWSIIILFIFFFIITAVLSMNSMNPSKKQVAYNLASSIAHTASFYYKGTESTDFIGRKYDFDGDTISFNKNIRTILLKGYNCLILDSSVVVTHKDGAKGEVHWR